MARLQRACFYTVAVRRAEKSNGLVARVQAAFMAATLNASAERGGVSGVGVWR